MVLVSSIDSSASNILYASDVSVRAQRLSRGQVFNLGKIGLRAVDAYTNVCNVHLIRRAGRSVS